jgi:hypothetical protein
VEFWHRQRLDRVLVRKVQELVVRRFAALQGKNPEFF